MNKEKVIEVLQMIADDQKNDAANFDGQPFNGRTVAEYFGNQGAAIAALANIVKEILLDTSGLTPDAADAGKLSAKVVIPSPPDSSAVYVVDTTKAPRR